MRQRRFLISNLQFSIPPAMTLSEPPQERRTAVQFNLRQLLLVMLAVALVSPLLPAVMPDWTPEQWRVFDLFMAALLVPLIAAAISGCLKRRRVERPAGLERASLPRRRIYGWNELFALLFWPWILFIHLSEMMNEIRFAGRVVDWSLFFWTPLLGAYLGWMLLRLWWNVGQFELCERGVILDALAFRPWSAVRTLRWNRVKKDTLMLDFGGPVRELPVPPKAAERVDAFLKDRFAAVQEESQT
jgi:hypothetical protein